jgi:hypothetical protein
MHHAKAALGRRVFPFGGATKPIERFGKILRHSFAVRIELAEPSLRARMILLCGFAEPFERFDRIARNSLAFFPRESDVKLAFGIILPRRPPIPAKRRVEVLRDT